MKIADFIREDLGARIQSNREIPRDLTLLALAHHYAVSITPVREAVMQLVDDGFLVKHLNGRLEVNTERIGSADTTPPEPPVNWDRVITEEVLLRSVRGDRDFLREQACAEQFGTGRAVIRRVFSRLAGAGMLTHEPRRGWRVRTLRTKDMVSYLDVRELLEIKALDEAWGHLDRRFLQEVLEHNQPLDGVPRLDNRLHQCWIDICDNHYIQDFFERQGRYFTALFEYAAPNAARTAEMAEQHTSILEAVLADDQTTARKALRDHIRDQHPTVSKLIEQLRESAKTSRLLVGSEA